MKRNNYKLVLLFTIMAFLSINVYSQSEQGFCTIDQSEIDDYNNKNGNCNTNLNGDFAYYDDLDSHIPYFDGNPLHTPPVKTIRVNINIFQKSDGTGTYPNNQETIDGLKQILQWANDKYHDCEPCDPIIGVTEIDDTNIRFSIGEEGNERIYFYHDDLLWNSGDTYALLNKVLSADPERGNSINLLITSYAGSPGNWAWMPSYTNLSKNHIVFMKKWSDDILSYGAANTLAHEFGHNLSMLHTYLGGNADANCNDNDEFLSDIFGLHPVSNCPHEKDWHPDACDNTIPNGDLITNNLMGGNKSNCYISPKQAGQMHRSLALTSARRFVEKTKSDMPLVIDSDETWDFDIRLYRDIIIESGTEVTFTCNVNMPYNGKIIVKQNAKLILDGATITTMDDEPWQGIEVWGNASEHQFVYDGNGNRYQGMLVLQNEAVIENALNAITLWNPGIPNSQGGIVQASDAFFYNNKCSVEFMPYQNKNPFTGTPMNNISNFRDCHFEVNDYYFIADDFEEHISMLEVNGISIRRSTFLNSMSTNLLGKAIYTEDAGFKVDGICSENYLPCPWTDSDRCYFEGFYKSIHAVNTGINNYTVIIKHTNFVNSTYGVNLESVNYASIVENNFEITTNEKDKEFCETSGKEIVGLGISLYLCSGYAIEENIFEGYTGSAGDFFAGVRVSYSIDHYNEIYKNTFSGIYYACDVVGPNYSGDEGVTFVCNQNENNTYDYFIWPPYGKIKQFQGSASKPAGNTFSDNALNFINDGPDLILYYWYSDDPNQFPEIVDNVVQIPTNFENTCPSHYGGNNRRSIRLSNDERIQSEQAYLQNLTGYNSIKGLIDGLKDGGNTETLKTEVETAWPNEMWELRAELLSKSPHLSVEVLTKTADKTEVLPESVIFEIMAANPDALRKGDLIDHLETKVNPLPGYMMDMLKQVAAGITYKTVLENQLSFHGSEMVKAVNDIVRSNLADTIENNTELRLWLSKIDDISTTKQVISSHLQDGDFSTAISLANNLPSLYDLNDQELIEHNYYLEILNLYNILNQQSRTIFQLDNLEIDNISFIANNSLGTAGSYAKNILSFAYGYEYCDCPYAPSSEGLKSTAIIDPSKSDDNLFNIVVAPNPASNWVTFNFSVPGISDEPKITITNVSGKTVDVLPLTGSNGQIVWDSREVESGVYFYRITSLGNSKTGKFIINK